MRTARGAAESLLVRGFSIGLRVVTGAIVNRILGPAGKGVLSVGTNAQALFSSLGSLSVGTVLVKETAQRENRWDAFLGNALVLAAVLGSGTVALAVAIYRIFPETLFAHLASGDFTLAVAAVPFLILNTYLLALIQCLNLTRVYNLVVFLEGASAFVLTLALILARFVSVSLLLWTTLVVPVLLTVVCLRVLARGGVSRPRFDWALFRESVRDGAQLHIGAIAMYVYYRIDVLILNAYSQPAEVGYYFVAVTITEILFMLPVALQVVLYPRISQEKAEPLAQEMSARAARLALTGSIAGAAVMAAAAPLLVRLLAGRAFLPSVALIWILLPGAAVQVFVSVLSALWIRQGRFRALSLSAVALAVINVGLNLLLIPRWSAAGAAAATSATYAAGFLVTLEFVRRYSGLRSRQVLIPTRADRLWLMEIFGGVFPSRRDVRS